MSFGSSWLPGIEIHGDAERLEARAKPLVARAAFVLHDVAGGDDQVDGAQRRSRFACSSTARNVA